MDIEVLKLYLRLCEILRVQATYAGLLRARPLLEEALRSIGYYTI